MRLIASAAIAVLLACPAYAQPKCYPTERVISELTQKRGEEVIAEGSRSNGTVVTMWGNTETGSWTVTGTKGGVTCVFDSGGDFKRIVLSPNV